ncbi:hypothetical protein, partial [Teredinibacter turnerae]|uniref:hypothetical protein n=1 Tax=Teredinibacter turnerae TaxID=2426 RepID=UPI001E653926
RPKVALLNTKYCVPPVSQLSQSLLARVSFKGSATHNALLTCTYCGERFCVKMERQRHTQKRA